MSVAEALGRRRSCRSFEKRPLRSGLIEELIDKARRTPTAGNSQGVEFLILDRPAYVADYWRVTLSDEEARRSFAFPALLQAPTLVVPYGLPDRYLGRYLEPDKAHTGLGHGVDRWSIPYWLVDAAFAAMALQLLAVDLGLGTCFFGLFDHEESVRECFGVPEGARAVGTIAIGYPDISGERLGRSSQRERRPLAEVVHRGSW